MWSRRSPSLSDNPLLASPETFATPHLAGFTDSSLEGTLEYLTEAVNKYREGKRIDSLLNEPESPRRTFKP